MCNAVHARAHVGASVSVLGGRGPRGTRCEEGVTMTNATKQVVLHLARTLGPLLLLGVPATAHAQEPPTPPSQAQPAPPSARASNGEYVAPLSQATQTTYVPQSVALSGPRVIADWEDGEAIPSGYHVANRARRGLVIGGAVTAGVLYLFSVLAASAMHDEGSYSGSGSRTGTALYVPGIGPFIQMASTSTATGNTFLAIDGIGQTGGIVMLALGIAGRNVLVRNDLGLTLSPMPMALGRSGGGLGVLGTF